MTNYNEIKNTFKAFNIGKFEAKIVASVMSATEELNVSDDDFYSICHYISEAYLDGSADLGKLCDTVVDGIYNRFGYGDFKITIDEVKHLKKMDEANLIASDRY